MTAVQLQEIAQVIRGVSFDKDEALDEERDGYLPILRAGNIDTDLLIDDDLIWVPDRRVAEEQRMRAGDIAICMSSGSQAVVGKTATLRRDWPGSVGAFCAVIRPQPDRVLPDWLAFFLRSEVFRTWTRQSTGANIKNIRKSELEAFPVPVPPMAEQCRIVDLLSRAEGIVRLRRQAQQKAAALIPAIFVDMFGDPATNPKRLPIAKIGEILKVKSGDFLPATRMELTGDILVYGGNGVIGKHTSAMFIEPKIVIGRVGALCGNVHMTAGPSWITDNALYVSEASPAFQASYLVQALRQADLHRYSSQVAQPLISASRIYPVTVLTPPLDAQILFDERVREVQSIVGMQTAALSLAEATFNALLARAFAVGDPQEQHEAERALA